MSRKMPPKWVSMAAPDPSPVEGVDNLPLPMGVNREAVQSAERESEATPGAMGVPMTSAGYSRECNGDNPSAPAGGLISGKDMRPTGPSPSSDATPGMPGA